MGVINVCPKFEVSMCALNMLSRCASWMCVLNVESGCETLVCVLDVRPIYASSMCVSSVRPQCVSLVGVLNECPQCVLIISDSSLLRLHKMRTLLQQRFSLKTPVHFKYRADILAISSSCTVYIKSN